MTRRKRRTNTLCSSESRCKENKNWMQRKRQPNSKVWRRNKEQHREDTRHRQKTEHRKIFGFRFETLKRTTEAVMQATMKTITDSGPILKLAFNSNQYKVVGNQWNRRISRERQHYTETEHEVRQRKPTETHTCRREMKINKLKDGRKGLVAKAKAQTREVPSRRK